MIHNCRELREAYTDLHLWGTLKRMTPPEKKHVVDFKIIQLKRDIRNYRDRSIREYPHLYIDQDFGSALEIVILPGNFTRRQVEKYYEDFMHMEYMPGPYDCTGQTFSVWHSAFETGLGWKVYHRIARDV